MMSQAAASAVAGYAGLAIFISIFLIVVMRLLRKEAREESAEFARIPFKED